MKAITLKVSLGTLLGIIALSGTMSRADGLDRHPELKSRALAWTEFDGSYLFDTSSRAEMLDAFWNVFNKPYGDHGWTGSAASGIAGTTSERWRVREYAQLNAYRALNGSPALTEDGSRINDVQATALVFAQNPEKPLSHLIDSSWRGYSQIAADVARSALLDTTTVDTDPRFAALFTPYDEGGALDGFVADFGLNNYSFQGHRAYTLMDAGTTITLGSSITDPSGPFVGETDANVCLLGALADNAAWNRAIQGSYAASLAHFVAFPSPGYFPLPLLQFSKDIRWTFVPANNATDFNVADAFNATYQPGTSNPFVLAPGLVPLNTTVTAKINGVVVTPSSIVRNNPPGPLVWDFSDYFIYTDPNFRTSLATPDGKDIDGAVIDITIHDVAILDVSDVDITGRLYVTGYRDYHYTVTFFDPAKITTTPFSPQSPLVNMSTRSVIGNGDNQMIAGFTVSGSVPVKVALRTQGPGLARFGIQNAAKTTHIRLYDANNQLLGENAAWKTHPNWRMLQSYNVAPSNDAEAGMVATLWPGRYTAVVGDDTGANGIGIVEAFNIDSVTPTKLVNLSTRGIVGSGDAQMIAGITIKDTARTVVIRTQGPGLARYGVANPVADTTLTVVDQSDGHTVAQNDDWQAGTQNTRLSTDLSSYAPSDAREAALVLNLPPGAYTALVASKGTAGVGIVEVFDVSP